MIVLLKCATIGGKLTKAKTKKSTSQQYEWGELFRTPDGVLHQYYPLHKYQKKVMASNKRIVAAIAGTGGGKTVMSGLWVIKQFEKNPKAKIIVVSPTYKMLNNGLMPEFKKTLDNSQFKGRETKGTTNAKYETKTGGTIYFYSATDPDSIQALHADAAVMDEAGLMSKKAFDVVRQRTNVRQGQILITSTPYKFNWLYHDVYVPWKNNSDKTIDLIQFDSSANPLVTQESLDYERSVRPEHEYLMLFEGQFTRPQGLIFQEFESCVIESLPPIDPQRVQMVGGIDWGFNDETACLSGFVVDDVLYVISEIYEKRKTVDDIIAMDDFDERVIWFCDNQRKDSILTLQRQGYYAKRTKKYNGSVLDNISRVNKLINSGRLKILPEFVNEVKHGTTKQKIKGGCPNLIREMSEWCWQEDEHGPTDRPVDKNNHAIDALCYLVEGAYRCRLMQDKMRS